MKNKLILLLAITFGLISALCVYHYLNNLKETYRSTGNFARVATARQKIPAKTPISAQMLEFIEMPTKYILPGVVVDAQDAVGKLAQSDIYPGEQIFSSKLIGKNDPAGGLAAKVAKGKRALSVPVTKVTGLHGQLDVGDYLDVIATFEITNQTRLVATSTIVQNVPVLAINKNADGTNKAQEEPQTVTIMVEPGQAQQIMLAIQQGSLQLSLRSPEDKEILPLPMTKLGHLMR